MKWLEGRRQCDAFGAESPSSSDTVKISFRIPNHLPFFFLGWHVVVYDELTRWHIDASSHHISSNKNINVALSKLLHHFISFFWGHFAKHDCSFTSLPVKNVSQSFYKVSRVNENEALSSSH